MSSLIFLVVGLAIGLLLGKQAIKALQLVSRIATIALIPIIIFAACFFLLFI